MTTSKISPITSDFQTTENWQLKMPGGHLMIPHTQPGIFRSTEETEELA